MQTGAAGGTTFRDVSTAVRASSLRLRQVQAVVGVAAVIGFLAFVDVLPPGTGEIAVASASTQDSAPDAPMPPPGPPAPPGAPAPAPVAPDVATAVHALQNLGDAPPPPAPTVA